MPRAGGAIQLAIFPGSELIKDRPPDSRGTIGLELNPPLGVKAAHGIKETQDPCALKRLYVDILGKLSQHSFGNVPHQGQVLLEQLIAEDYIFSTLVLPPHLNRSWINLLSHRHQPSLLA